jgi:hypothetical protein
MPLRTASALGSTPRQVTYPPAPSTATVVSSVHTVKGPKTASGLGKSCARGGPQTGRQPLKNRHSPENIPNPPRSVAGTTESEAPGVHIVYTLFCEHFDALPNQVSPPFAPCKFRCTVRHRFASRHYSPGGHPESGELQCLSISVRS